MMDPSLNVAQRNNACFELRGATEPEVIAGLASGISSGELATRDVTEKFAAWSAGALVPMPNIEVKLRPVVPRSVVSPLT